MAKTPSAPTPSDEQDAASAGGKGRATPTRAEQEAARRRPLVPDTKEARARAKADLTARRERARVGMANGEEQYLPARDKGPQRRFVRDWVDSRWHFAEIVMPAMIVVILVSMIGNVNVQVYSFIALWAFIFVVIIEMFITGRRVKKAVGKAFGESKVERGTAWYAASRSMQMRFMRLPKAQVKRGGKPVTR